MLVSVKMYARHKFPARQKGGYPCPNRISFIRSRKPGCGNRSRPPPLSYRQAACDRDGTDLSSSNTACPRWKRRNFWLQGPSSPCRSVRPAQIEWKERGQYRGQQCVPGNVSLTPANTRDALRWHGEANEFLVCELDPAFLVQSVRETSRQEKIELRQVRGVQDARITAILTGLRADMNAGYSSGPLFGETLATALALHLVQAYAAAPAMPFPVPPLARSELRRALDYIHDHLASDLTLAEIAAAAGLSPSHFARLFRQATGQPPHQYVLTARIERAQYLLRQPDASVSAVAIQLGFYDESHFIRHFRRITGTAPGAWRTK